MEKEIKDSVIDKSRLKSISKETDNDKLKQSISQKLKNVNNTISK